MIGYAGNVECADAAGLFRHIRDFLTAENGIADYRGIGPGWSVVDQSYAGLNPATPAAGDWCVLGSPGEANAYPVFLKLTYGGSRHAIAAYLGWDASTHRGAVEAYYADNINHTGAATLIHMHADLDEVCVLYRPAAAAATAEYTACMAGRLPAGNLLYDGEAVQLADAVAAGTNVVVTLPSWPGWAAAGKRLYSWDGVGISEVEIVEADEATRRIVLASASARAAGSWLAEDACIYVTSSYSGTQSAVGTIHAVPGRSGNVGTDMACTATAGGMTACVGPDAKYGERLAFDVFAGAANTACRGHFGLVRETSAPAAAGEAWLDREGTTWRLYRVYSAKNVAVREG